MCANARIHNKNIMMCQSSNLIYLGSYWVIPCTMSTISTELIPGYYTEHTHTRQKTSCAAGHFLHLDVSSLILRVLDVVLLVWWYSCQQSASGDLSNLLALLKTLGSDFGAPMYFTL